MAAYLTLTDENGNVYNFPPSIWIRSQKISVNSSVRKLAYAHGGEEIADQYINARQITLEGSLYSDTQAAFETAKRNLIQAILKGGYLTLSNDIVSRRIFVKPLDYNPDFEYMTFDNIFISFVAKYPFWEDSAETEESNVVAGDDNFLITISGSDDIMLPIIEIEADQSADLPSVKMYNLNDGGISFSYNDPYFLAEDVLSIDSKLGTVKRNGNDTISYFVDPCFLRLQPGDNNIYYEGNAATINIKFRKVYL